MSIQLENVVCRISQDEFMKIDDEVMSHAFPIHNRCGLSGDESVYPKLCR